MDSLDQKYRLFMAVFFEAIYCIRLGKEKALTSQLLGYTAHCPAVILIVVVRPWVHVGTIQV